MHRLLVREVMQTSVITIGPEELVVDAAGLMEEHGIRRLPVVDTMAEDGLVGIITDSDVLEAETADSVLSAYDPDVDQEWLAVADIMTNEVVTIGPDATVGQLAQLFLDERIGGVPVVVPAPDDPDRLQVVGIITEADVFRLIADAWVAEVEAG